MKDVWKSIKMESGELSVMTISTTSTQQLLAKVLAPG